MWEFAVDSFPSPTTTHSSPIDTDKGHSFTMASVPSVQCFGKKKTGEFLAPVAVRIVCEFVADRILNSHRCRPLQGMKTNLPLGLRASCRKPERNIGGGLELVE